MELPPDITAFVAASFEPTHRAEALSLLAKAKLHDGTDPDARMLRCALVISRGDLPALARSVALLAIDYRDVIMGGEYELRGKEAVWVRDLAEPFRPET